MKLTTTFALLLLALGTRVFSGSAKPAAGASSVDDYSIVWTTPSRDASGSMPLGNGDIGLNAWVEADGDLVFYIGKTDSWGDNGRLLKPGKVRVAFSPPLTGEGRELRQTLRLSTAEMLLETWAGGEKPGPDAKTLVRLWVDANHPVIHVTLRGPEARQAMVSIEPWRTEAEELPSLEVSDVLLDRSRPDRQQGPTIVEPDTIIEDDGDRIGWYHHNRKSVGPELTMRTQGIQGVLGEDPLLHRTFGAVVTADGAERIDPVTLGTGRGTSQRIHVYVLTCHPATPDEWLDAMDALLLETGEVTFEARRRAHESWWRAFWSRSWIHIRQAERDPPALVPANGHPLRFGVDQSGGNRLRGRLGRVSIFERALGDEEIARLASAGRKASPRVDGLVVSLDDVEPGRSLPPGGTPGFQGSWTAEAWVRPEKLPSGGGRIIDKISPGGSDGFLLDTWPGNSLRLITGSRILGEKDCLPAGEWHHVAARVDSGRGEIALFLGGERIAGEQVEVVSDAFAVSRGYQLQRFINACAGRGRFPIKFNGSIFTVPSPGAPGDADYRRWGPGYWWQNTRLPYISMCTSGDFDLMEPLFRMYSGTVLEVSKVRTRRYFGHGGAFYPECIYFWGAVFSDTYGWKPFEERGEDKLQVGGWHKYEWVCGPELVSMMLDYYEHTGDEVFLRERLLPTAREVLEFFEEHYDIDERGRLYMHPSQALETWWDCTNPMPELAGLHAITARLLRLPEGQASAGDREGWRRLQAKLPELPLREVNGVQMLAPAERFENKRNIENPELYAVFPFRLVAVGRPDIEWGRKALEHRWDRGHSGWRQDDIFMAYLGLAEEARRNVVRRARQHDPNSRFPAFWGPNYDWVPDQDHGGVLLEAVQALLLQTDGDDILLLPAWPDGWDADFKLHAPRRTVVEGKVREGRLMELVVTPEARRRNVRICR